MFIYPGLTPSCLLTKYMLTGTLQSPPRMVMSQRESLDDSRGFNIYFTVGNPSPGLCKHRRILCCRPGASPGVVPGCRSRCADSPRACRRRGCLKCSQWKAGVPLTCHEVNVPHRQDCGGHLRIKAQQNVFLLVRCQNSKLKVAVRLCE